MHPEQSRGRAGVLGSYLFLTLTVIPSSEYRAGSQPWVWDVGNPSSRALNPSAGHPPQVCTQLCKHWVPLPLVEGTELSVVPKSYEESFPNSEKQPKGLSVMY